MSKLHSLKGKVQNYAWGGKSYIPNLLGIRAEGRPCAEYWLGAHVNAPSVLTDTGTNLDSFIEANAKEVLGEITESKFGRLPFLFKVLDVNDMLSIQVHPTKAEAEKGFANENELGIALDAPNRNYKDNNHKPEIMVALSEFWLLHGFLPEAELKKTLQTTQELTPLVSIFEEAGYRGLYQHVMEEPDETTNQVLQPLINRVLKRFEDGELNKASADYWAAKAYKTFCSDDKIDKGLYSIYFFNVVKMMPGQAVFQDAGIPHAYMQGQNMELMANSDNVIRGGLTPKHVDVPELLKHVAFEKTHPHIMKGELQPDGLERIYKSPAPDFQLSKIELTAGTTYKSEAKTAEVLMVIDGEIEITERTLALKLKRGESCFLESESTYEINSSSSAVIYKATTP
ncbi:mannose-6-phosphate isomerase, type 1 [Reichenbachiella faecimaris]|uniref:mannose-6-phosphate isomerase n=1 Tax=Reichenbachiella faecimaris TaxID=692418 RepID=A0A1W2G7S0_REIFA|nr:mannose-6-phosphate isomerase, class I [Reichenbachiella faecimaris]SMD32554.1 mannose-6-phosphate isomerase, type 1 [Reichenbachiella faecimaris]